MQWSLKYGIWLKRSFAIDISHTHGAETLCDFNTACVHIVFFDTFIHIQYDGVIWNIGRHVSHSCFCFHIQ